MYEEPTSYTIFKVDAKRTLPFDDVKAQIVNSLTEQKFKDAIQEALNSAKTSLNDDYFKVPEKPASAGAPAPVGPKPPEPETRPAPQASPAPQSTPQPAPGSSAAPK